MPSNKDGIRPYKKTFVIKPYTEIAITTKARFILINFNSIPPRIIELTRRFVKKLFLLIEVKLALVE